MIERSNLHTVSPGTQIIYVPDHAGGNVDHPDCEAGFVTSVKVDRGIVFCRFWHKKRPGVLRTGLNSEAVSLQGG